MLLRPFRILRSRVGRFLTVTFLLAATWTAWSHWPPQPDWRVVVQGAPYGGSPDVSSDGRWLRVRRDTEPAGGAVQGQVEVFDLSTGTHCLTLRGKAGANFWVSPSGSRLFCWDANDTGQLLSLPAGDLVRSLPRVDRDQDLTVKWTPDGRHLLLFNPRLSVYQGEGGECVGHFDVTKDSFALQANGGGFAAVLNDRWELLLHSFDPAVPDAVVPLPGPPSDLRRHPEKRPADGSVSVHELAVNADGTAVFTFVVRHQQDGDKDRQRRYLARWDRSTQKWTEADMGPVMQWGSPGKKLRIDGVGKYLVTREAFHGFICGTGIVFDPWGREEAERLEDRDVWDATSSPPRCLNDDGLPKGLAFVDPTGRRILLENEKNTAFALYAADSLARLSAQEIEINWMEEPIFSADGEWLVLSVRDYGWKPTWLPGQVADWIEHFIRRAGEQFRVIRLADGKTVRQLAGRSSPKFTSDGYLWTVTQRGRIDDTATLMAERWSPASPGRPWWLLSLTAAGICAMVLSERCRCRDGAC